MPLRDHFRGRLGERRRWGGIHAQWPGHITAALNEQLPPEYSAEPRVQLGRAYEVDIGMMLEPPDYRYPVFPVDRGSSATATMTMPAKTLTKVVEFDKHYRYEVLIYKRDEIGELVAAIEIVSPGNQDRPQERRNFIEKCSALLKNGVCVSMIDIVTNKDYNLYSDLLVDYDAVEPAFGTEPPATYAATCRFVEAGDKARLDSWAYPLAVGQPLVKLPIWLNDEDMVTVDLEATYEEACRVLRIP